MWKLSKIKIATTLNAVDMTMAGASVHANGWSDKELALQIAALRLTIAYLRARKDSGIVLYKLIHELDSFESYRFSRETP